ncbi:MAG: hypothetical protein LT071_07995 [Nocardioides sp.]|nr:hypothetical protein [Nocardioides sp.]
MNQAGPPRPHPRWGAGLEPGPQVVALGVALTLTAVTIDVVLAGRLSLFFDLAFIAACLLLAVMVRRGDFFVVGLLPPLLMIGVFTFLALIARDVVADPRDNVVQAVVSGLAHHSTALFVGYALCLAWLGWRLRSESDIAAELGTEWDTHPEHTEDSGLEA